MNDNQTNKFKTLTIGTRVTAAQKKLYKETAESLGFGLSEYMADLMQMYYNAYESYGKQRLISSIFPEKIEFDGKKCLTTRINDVLRYMLQIDKELPENKKGQISKNMSLSRVVESEGIEPSSKQAKKVLSTRLVFI